MSLTWSKKHDSTWFKEDENTSRTKLTLPECLASRPIRSRRGTASDKKINILAVLLVPTIFYWFYFRSNVRVAPPYVPRYSFETVPAPDEPILINGSNFLLAAQILNNSTVTIKETGDTEAFSKPYVEVEKDFCVITRVSNEENKTLTINRNPSIGELPVLLGGYYKPPDCKSRTTVGILIPYRDRKNILEIFINNIHPFLIRQKLEYRLFVIEQSGELEFNRGKLLNAGFLEMEKIGQYDCVVFHDVDLLPTNNKISYACTKTPRHLSTSVVGEDKRFSPYSLFGGVTSMRTRDFKKVNGFSNLYWGLGGEDNDMFWRLKASGLKVLKLFNKTGVYECISNKTGVLNPNRYHLLSTAVQRYKTEGLSSARYIVLSYQIRQEYTHIVIDIDPHNKTETRIPTF